MPIHLLSGMKGKFEVVEDDATTASRSSIPGPSPEMQGIGDTNDNEVEAISSLLENSK